MKQKLLHIHSLLAVLLLVASALFTTSCSKKVGFTQILVQDSIRHYYPMVQGQDLTLLWRVANVGKVPLVINDIQPSCGCVVVDLEDNNVVPAGKEILIKMIFHSERNTGYVRHTVRLFGNVAPKGMVTFVFDTNVVAPALGSPDYEEVHKDRNEYDILSGAKTLVDGDESTKGYWTDESEYSRGYNKYYWRKGRK